MFKSLFLASIITLLGVSTVASAQQPMAPDAGISSTIPVPTGQDLGQGLDFIKQIVEGFKAGNFRVAFAALITFILFIWRRFFSGFVIAKIQDHFWIAMITVGMGFISSLSVLLVMGEFSWGKFLLEGFITSAEAMALWTLIGKKLLPQVFGKLPE